jgi:uncharacterized protein YegJ (DUF2314 family)
MYPKQEKGNVGMVCSGCIQEMKDKFRKSEHKIKPGVFVKHRFIDPSGDTESMWIQVTEIIDEKNVRGILRNHPVMMFDLNYGMKIDVSLDECIEFLPSDE